MSAAISTSLSRQPCEAELLVSSHPTLRRSVRKTGLQRRRNATGGSALDEVVADGTDPARASGPVPVDQTIRP